MVSSFFWYGHVFLNEESIFLTNFHPTVPSYGNYCCFWLFKTLQVHLLTHYFTVHSFIGFTKSIMSTQLQYQLLLSMHIRLSSSYQIQFQLWSDSKFLHIFILCILYRQWHGWYLGFYWQVTCTVGMNFRGIFTSYCHLQRRHHIMITIIVIMWVISHLVSCWSRHLMEIMKNTLST